MKRNGFIDVVRHWPNGVLPYRIADNLDRTVLKDVYSAMAYISNHSCIRFKVAKSAKDDHVLIENDNGCSSYLGNLRRGKQELSIGSMCSWGNIVHEILHSLGFFHMHETTERDKFIKIDYSNIISGLESNFAKSNGKISMFGTEYDYGSILHYPKYAFAKNQNLPTIVPLKRAGEMGQRQSMQTF